MKSSAVKARINETEDAMRMPVAMYGTELGSAMRHSRVPGGTPKERAVSVVTGSMSRMPYIVCTRMGQKAPNVARKISLEKFVPSVRKRSGISAADGIGRKNSIGTRNAVAAKSLSPSATPRGTASTVASASPTAQPRSVCPKALQNAEV